MSDAKVVILMNEAALAERKLLGHRPLERTLLALQYGGVSACTIATDVKADVNGAADALKKRIEKQVSKLAISIVDIAAISELGKTIFIAGDGIINPAAVQAALKTADSALIGGTDGAIAVARGDDLPMAALRGGFDAIVGEADLQALPLNHGVIALRLSRTGRSNAIKQLLETLKKPADSWFVRLVIRNLSRYLTRAFAATPITPNQVTLLAMASGLACAAVAFFSATHFEASRWGFALAFGLGLLGEVFDASDGELARVAYRFSPWGAWLDTATDDICSIATHSAVAYSAWRLLGSTWGAIGTVGVSLFAIYVAVLYRDLLVYVKSGDTHSHAWWVSPKTAHEDAVEWAAGKGLKLSDFTRSASNREIILLVYLITALVGLVQIGILYFALNAVALGVIAIGQLIFGYPGAKKKAAAR